MSDRRTAMTAEESEANKLYLYNYGDEFTDVTGGWGNPPSLGNVVNKYDGWAQDQSVVRIKENDYLFLKFSGSRYARYISFRTNNIINVNNFSKMKILYVASTSSLGNDFLLGVNDVWDGCYPWSGSAGSVAISARFPVSNNVEIVEVEADISSIGQQLSRLGVALTQYGAAATSVTTSIKIYSIWLEK